jgi:DNA repair exonuclease SbcCD nuclease subunit
MIDVCDPHFGRKQDTIMVKNDILPECGLPELNSRTYDLVNRMNYASEFAQKNNHSLVIAGDVFNIVSPSTRTISIFNAWLGRTLKMGVVVYIMPGNHDSTVTWVNSGMLMGLESVITNFYIIDRVSIWEIDGMRVLMIPHIPRDLITPDSFSILKEADKYDLVVGHGQIVGSSYDNDCFYEAGKAVEFTYGMFPENTQVVLGHEHAYKVYKGEGNVRVYYPGSVVENNFGEAGDEKRFAVVTNGVISFENYPDLKYPYMNIDIDLTEKDFSYTPDDIRDICQGKVIKVRATAKDALAVNQVKISQVITEAGGYVVRFETILLESEERTDVSMITNHDHRALLKKYLAGQDDLTKAERDEAYLIGEKVIEGGAE